MNKFKGVCLMALVGILLVGCSNTKKAEDVSTEVKTENNAEVNTSKDNGTATQSKNDTDTKASNLDKGILDYVKSVSDTYASASEDATIYAYSFNSLVSALNTHDIQVFGNKLTFDKEAYTIGELQNLLVTVAGDKVVNLTTDTISSKESFNTSIDNCTLIDNKLFISSLDIVNNAQCNYQHSVKLDNSSKACKGATIIGLVCNNISTVEDSYATTIRLESQLSRLDGCPITVDGITYGSTKEEVESALGAGHAHDNINWAMYKDVVCYGESSEIGILYEGDKVSELYIRLFDTHANTANAVKVLKSDLK